MFASLQGPPEFNPFPDRGSGDTFTSEDAPATDALPQPPLSFGAASAHISPPPATPPSTLVATRGATSATSGTFPVPGSVAEAAKALLMTPDEQAAAAAPAPTGAAQPAAAAFGLPRKMPAVALSDTPEERPHSGVAAALQHTDPAASTAQRDSGSSAERSSRSSDETLRSISVGSRVGAAGAAGVRTRSGGALPLASPRRLSSLASGAGRESGSGKGLPLGGAAGPSEAEATLRPWVAAGSRHQPPSSAAEAAAAAAGSAGGSDRGGSFSLALSQPRRDAGGPRTPKVDQVAAEGSAAEPEVDDEAAAAAAAAAAEAAAASGADSFSLWAPLPAAMRKNGTADKV